jgi:hypothetical protein
MQKRPTSKVHSAANQGGPGKQSDMLRCPRAYPRIHQLNNNLMTILVHCELMKSSVTPEEFEHLSAIRSAATSIAEGVGKGRANSNGGVLALSPNKTERGTRDT